MSLLPVFSAAEADALNDRVLREAPAEKVRAVLAQAQIGRALDTLGSCQVPGIGQRVGAIDLRTFLRWHQQYPGCWNDKAFRDEFLRDNPQCKAKGYKVKNRPSYVSLRAKMA